MRLASPEWLLLIGVALAAAAGAAWWSRRRRRRLASQVDPALFGAMTDADRPTRARRRQWWLGLLALVFAAAALARPQYGQRTEVRKGLGIELVFALDLSRSMLAEDVKPSRLKRAQLELEDLLRRLEGHRVGLVGFTTVGIPLTPLTIDRSAVHLQLERADPSIMPRGGTSLAQAIDAAKGLLDAAPTPDAGRAIIVVTDGEDHEGRAEAAARRAHEAGVDVHVVGIGGTEGQPIPVYEEGARRGYVQDDRGRTVLTRLEPDSLRAIARAGGGVAALPGPRDGGIDFEPLRSHLAQLDEAELQARTVRVYEERYRWFLWPALVLLLLSTLLSARRRPQAPTGRASSLALVVLVGGLSAPDLARAQSLIERPEPEVQAGVDALRSGDAEAAEETFDQLIERRGPSPELWFDRGLARAARERWDEAAQDFERAAREASDPALRAKSLFALGNAHRREERLNDAISAYRQALLTDPSLEGARRNLEVTRAMQAMAPPPPPSGGGESEEQDGQPEEEGEEQDSSDPSEDRGEDDGSPEAGSGEEDSGESDTRDAPRPDDGEGPESDRQPGEDGGESEGEDGPSSERSPAAKPTDPGEDRPSDERAKEGASPADGPEQPSSASPSTPAGQRGAAGASTDEPDDVDALLEALRQQERVLQKKLYQRRYGQGRPVEKDW